VNGVIRKGDKVKFFNTGKEYDADEIGVLKMDMVDMGYDTKVTYILFHSFLKFLECKDSVSWTKIRKGAHKKNALITYPMYQRIFYNIPITFLVQLHKQFAFNFLSRDFVLSQ
jgi:translation elongation factor EF-4